VLRRLGERGVTFGKADGNGLGFTHAKTFFAQASGNLEIQSKVGAGTRITGTLPAAPAPAWFAPHLGAPPRAGWVVLDDDRGVHKLWEMRLEPKPSSFNSASRVSEWLAADPDRAKSHRFLLDHEIRGESLTGLALIERHGLQEHAILVTSSYDDPELQQACAHLGVAMVPKSMIPFVPRVH